MLTRLASFSLITAVLLLTGCHSHHYHDRDGGYRDDHRHKHDRRHDRDDDRRYQSRDYR